MQTNLVNICFDVNIRNNIYSTDFCHRPGSPFPTSEGFSNRILQYYSMRIAIGWYCVFLDTLHGSSYTSVSFVLRFSFVCLFMCFKTFYWSFQETIDHSRTLMEKVIQTERRLTEIGKKWRERERERKMIEIDLKYSHWKFGTKFIVQDHREAYRLQCQDKTHKKRIKMNANDDCVANVRISLAKMNWK